MTVSSVIEEALRMLLARRSERPTQAVSQMPLATEATWVRPGIDIYDNSHLGQILDSGRDVSVLR